MGRYRRIDRSEVDLNKFRLDGDPSQSLINDTRITSNSQNENNNDSHNHKNHKNGNHKRKKRFGKKKKTPQSFNPLERDRIETYLIQYRDGSQRACFTSPDLQNQTSTGTLTGAGGGVGGPDEVTVRISNKKDWHHESQATMIGGHEFPA